MKKIIRNIIIILLLASMVGLLGFLYVRSKEKPEVFETQSPTIGNIIKKTVATGSVVPRKEIEIKPQVSGIIAEIYVEAGVMVEKDQVLAKVKIIPDMVVLNSAESRLNRAKLGFEDARIDFKRQSALFEKQVISQEDYQKAKLSYSNSKEELQAAENNLELVKNGVTKKSKTVTNTLIRSTINGMVLDVPIKEGNSVIQSNTFNDGTTIATVADMSDMIFEGKVDETEVGKIEKGMPLELTIGAIEDEKFAASLEYISPKGKEEQGAIQFEIKAQVTQTDGKFIRAGYSANANIVLQRRDSVLMITESLLKFEKDTAYVEVETDPQVFERRNIETGLSDGINIEVLAGVTEEDKIKGHPKKDKKK